MIEEQMDLRRICPFREQSQALLDEEDEVATLRATITVDGVHRSDVETRRGRVSGVVRRVADRREDGSENRRTNESERRGLSILVDVDREARDVRRTTEFLFTHEFRRRRRG